MSTRKSAKMSGLVTAIVSLLLFTTLVNSQLQDIRQPPLSCPPTSSCSCYEYTDLEIQCPRFEPRVIVKVQRNNYVHFDCENMTMNEYELVPELELGAIKFLQFTKCPLPRGISVLSYLKNIKIDRIRSFQFISGGANHNVQIESQHFRGFGDIEWFDLRGMENEIQELPVDVFEGMEKLTWVRIRVAKIRLPMGIFEPLANLEFLELGHNKLESLEAGFLKNQRKLRVLNLWGNALRNLKKESFLGLDSVTELDLSSNGMESLESDVLFHLTSLTDINLSANHFSTLPEGLFANNGMLRNFRLLENRVKLETLPNDLLANLTELDTVSIKCDLRRIPEGIFEGSMKIENMSLQNNALDDLPKDLLKDQVNLMNLDLSGNQITQLDDKLFLSTTALRKLQLSRNKLASISKSLLRSLSKLTHLFLDNNLITDIDSMAFHDLKAVEFIALQNNRITLAGEVINNTLLGEQYIPKSSPFQLLDRLKELNLANNSIRNVFEDFTLKSLELLNMSHNHIKTLSTDELQSLSRNGLTIDFSYNQIYEFDFVPSADPSMPNIVVLLNNNPFTCDCHILNLVRHLRNGKKSENPSNYDIRIGELICSKPENMENKLVSALNPLELVCPLDMEETSKKLCPEDCQCMVRPEDRHLIIECDANANLELLPGASSSNLRQTELKMENNNLTMLPMKPSLAYKEITSLLVSGNEISQISAEQLPTRLRVLEIHDNKLTTLNESAMNFLKNSSTLEQLTLSGNPWSCECNNLNFMNFVQKLHLKIADYSEMKCQDGRMFNVLKPSDLCKEYTNLIIIVSIATAFLGLLLGGLAALYYKYQKQIKMWLYSHNMCLWFVTEEELDKDKRYDAFVSYSHRDADFVADYLLPELENGTIPYKLCVHERDWSPGLEISTQISNSVNDAKRTIIVMSPHYLQSNWAQWEFRVAQSHAATEKRSRIIVILYGDIGDINKLEPDIRDYLRLNTYVKWGDRWFWEKLKYAMPHVKSSERVEKRGLVKTGIKSSVDDKLELIKPISVTPPQLTTPPAEKLSNPLLTTLNAKNASKGHNDYNGHLNGAFVINTSSRQSDV